MRIALGVQYDGAAFNGWQTQPGGRTVQDHLERALAQFCDAGTPRIATICAGRTDAGVHATAQVVHLDAPVERDESSWIRGVNRWLPQTVAVRWARKVPDTFHARFGATERRYDYWLLNDPVRAPLMAQRVGWVFRPLALAPMQQAARYVVGTHDFSSFRSSECQAASPVRELRELEIAGFGRLIRFRFSANAFLHHMVRNLVGTLVYVGLGRHEPAWAKTVLDAHDRSAAAPTFDAAGLYLTAVHYDPGFDLPKGDAVDFPCTGPA